jgi:hypothetical protein
MYIYKQSRKALIMLNPIKKNDAPTPAYLATLDGLLTEAVMMDNPVVKLAVLEAILRTANICHDIVQASIDSAAESDRQDRIYYRG